MNLAFMGLMLFLTVVRLVNERYGWTRRKSDENRRGITRRSWVALRSPFFFQNSVVQFPVLGDADQRRLNNEREETTALPSRSLDGRRNSVMAGETSHIIVDEATETPTTNPTALYPTMSPQASQVTDTNEQDASVPSKATESCLLLLQQTLPSPSKASISQSDQERRVGYKTRLESFHPATYFAKPCSISPIVVARFG